jgi:GT2 family glycosyltransferase
MCEVDSISGACIAVPRKVIDKVGPLDPDFFMFYEEVEWCHRIRRAGWKVYYVPDARITHHWMGSVKQSPKTMTSQLFRSQPLYYRKTVGPGAARLSTAIMTMGLVKNAVLHAGVAVKRGLRRMGLISKAPA